MTETERDFDDCGTDRERETREWDSLLVMRRLPRNMAMRSEYNPLGCDPAQLFARIRSAQMIGAVKGWDGRGLLLAGPAGRGKSSAAAWLFRRLLTQGRVNGGHAWAEAQGLHWFAAADLGSAYREHKLGAGAPPEIVEARSASILFLDDLGWEGESESPEIARLVSSRYDAGLLSVVTTGLPPADLSKRYTAATIRRLSERSRMVFDFDGQAAPSGRQPLQPERPPRPAAVRTQVAQKVAELVAHVTHVTVPRQSATNTEEPLPTATPSTVRIREPETPDQLEQKRVADLARLAAEFGDDEQCERTGT